jgi:hypothetical protein
MLALYSRVTYVGPTGLYEDIEENDVGYVIEDYGDGSYEVEFSEADGSTKALAAIPSARLRVA